MAAFSAADFQPDFGVPYPRWTEADLAKLTTEEVMTRLKGKQIVEQNAKIDPVQFGYTLESWRQCMEDWEKYHIQVICGGNRCLGYNSKIYDPVLGVERKIGEIDSDFHVFAWDGEALVAAHAEKPFIKGYGTIFKIRLSSGQSFEASAAHRVLTPSGWRSIGSLQPGAELFHPASSSGVSRLGHTPGARHYCGTRSGSPGGYRPSPRLCGALLPLDQDSDRDVSLSPADVPTHIYSCDNNRHLRQRPAVGSFECSQGVLAQMPLYIRACRESGRPSNWDALGQSGARCAGKLWNAVYKPCKSALRKFWGLRSWRARQQSAVESDHLQSCGEFARSDTGLYGSSFVDSVVITSIERESIGAIYDTTVAAHENYLCAGVIHHNSSKSSYAASLVVHAAMTIPEAKIRCYHVNEEKSIAEQQAMVWAALPDSFKNMGRKKGQNYSIQYSQKNGFTSSKLILPPMEGATRGAEILFCNYQQYKNDAQTAEGWWAHLVWCDEEAPLKLFETLQYRLTDAKGRMIMTFTTLNGWTALVSSLMSRTRTVAKRYSPILKREIPTVQDSLNGRGIRIYYWWTVDNPFLDGQDFMSKLEGKSTEEVLARAHGIPTKSAATPFPGFDDTVHVVMPDKLPWLVERTTKDGKRIPPPDVTRYHVVDPSGSKPWAMIWAAVTPLGEIYVYREWPDETFGEWAEVGQDERGKAGPAQRPMRWGFKDYVDLFGREENGEVIHERIMDPRLGNTSSQGVEEATSIISELDDLNCIMIPAPGLNIEHGIQLINDKLQYDDKQPLSPLNAPKLYISEKCQNLIFAMKNYTARGGKDEASKDFIDCLRYLLMRGADYIDMKQPVSTRSMGSY